MGKYQFELPEEFKPDRSVTSSVGRETPISGGKLKIKDLLEHENLNKIRTYMIGRKGVDYSDKDDEELVDDFVDHMRYFNTNMISTAGEVRYVSKATENQKKAAADAYELYDNLGSVFVNDGMYGAVSGVGTYVAAALKDPTNYFGLFTGGLGKMAAYGVSKGGKEVIKKSVQAAMDNAVAQGIKGEALRKVKNEALESAVSKLALKGTRGKTADKIVKKIVDKEEEIFLSQLRTKAAKEITDPLDMLAAKYSLYGTAALDSTFAFLNDVSIQNVMMDVGVQEEYNKVQGAFSLGLGAIAPAAQLAGRKFKGTSGLEDTGEKLAEGKLRTEQEQLIKNALPTPAIKKAVSSIKKSVSTWEQKWKRGTAAYDNKVTPVDLLESIMLGEDKKGGLAQIFKENGMKLGPTDKVSDVMTDIVSQLPQDELKEINETLSRTIGVTLGETTEIATNLGDLLAKDIRTSAQALNIMSQTRKSIDAGLAHGIAVMDSITGRADVTKAIKEEEARAGKAKLGQYGQSVWRRLLVSSPATTAINVVGFNQYLAGQTLADLFSSLSMGTASLGFRAVGNREKADELQRIAGVYKTMQAQRMRNLMDPHTTHDAYMAFLDQNKDVSKALFESFSGGVERATKRFGIDEKAKWFQRTEKLTEIATTATGVKAQDTFTKSQMFMTELDKHLRIKKKKSLQDVLATGTVDDIDDDVLSLALDTTLKSVYSKDYTKGQDFAFIEQAAKFTESISNMPLLGTVLPFGRFFNNVIATTYQFSPLAMAESAAKIARQAVKDGSVFPIERRAGQKISDIEAFSRATVGTTALILSMQYDEKRREKNLGVYEIEGSGGAIIDAKNTFPFSLWLVGGRVLNMMRNDETVPPELLRELGTQAAVGQLASDVQFGNDLNNILDTLINQDKGARKSSLDAFYKATGNFAAGFTRPLDAVNKLTGYIMETDSAKDLRQVSGASVFTQASTRYIDNIFEIISDKTEAVTGEELRVASRSGELYDANPLAKIFGLTIKRGRTNTEKVYSMADMADWTASERSNIPQYDKVFNTHVAPLLEKATGKLLKDKRFVQGDSDTKRVMLTYAVNEVKREVRKYLKEDAPGRKQLLALRRKASEHGNKALRTKAKKIMQDKFNFEGSITDMTYKELKFFMDYIDYMEDYLKE